MAGIVHAWLGAFDGSKLPALPIFLARWQATPLLPAKHRVLVESPAILTTPAPNRYAPAMDGRRAEVTRLLQAGAAAEPLLAIVYEELRGIARNRMKGERSDHTLQATALVHEAYARLCDHRANWRDRGHFFAAASEAMRRVLIDHARRAQSEKRGGDWDRVTLGAVDAVLKLDLDRTLELDDALTRLEQEDKAAADVTKLRFYGGLTIEETASALDLSQRSVHRRWVYARARLFELLEDPSGSDTPDAEGDR